MQGEHLDDFVLGFLNEHGIENKFFIEAGANDGLSYSNTSLLELYHGWKGVCVEPNYENYLRCVQNRPNSKCFHGALVSADHASPIIKGIFNSSSVSRANGLMSGCTEGHLSDFPEWICDVPALTLTEILLKSEAPANPDLLSLDVENYELEALAGLDFSLFRPRVVMMEIGCWYMDGVIEKHMDFMRLKGYTFHSKDPIQKINFIFLDL